MQVYIVGGAVRDLLLKRPIKDKDFVVVGATPEEMLDAGFVQVGADFPVFLHPKTKAEYALARTERKSGKGYKGFEVYASPEVTLEQDLLRRDLTINAMAIEVKSLEDDTPLTGAIIDPYGGKDDINNKVLRHVSEAFSEDPLRVLRIARFYGRFYNENDLLNFKIAPETLELINIINTNDELKHLTAERVWQETSRALMQNDPQAYFDCLIQVNSLNHVMPSLAEAFQDEFTKALIFRALKLSGQMNLKLHQRWTILSSAFADEKLLRFSKSDDSFNDSDSYFTWLTQWKNKTNDFSTHLKVQKKLSSFTTLYINNFKYLSDYNQCGASEIAVLIASTKADKDPKTFNELMQTQMVIELSWQQLDFTKAIYAYNTITIKDIDENLQGKAIGEALTSARINAIKNFK